MHPNADDCALPARACSYSSNLSKLARARDSGACGQWCALSDQREGSKVGAKRICGTIMDSPTIVLAAVPPILMQGGDLSSLGANEVLLSTIDFEYSRAKYDASRPQLVLDNTKETCYYLLAK